MTSPVTFTAISSRDHRPIFTMLIRLRGSRVWGVTTFLIRILSDTNLIIITRKIYMSKNLMMALVNMQDNRRICNRCSQNFRGTLRGRWHRCQGQYRGLRTPSTHTKPPKNPKVELGIHQMTFKCFKNGDPTLKYSKNANNLLLAKEKPQTIFTPSLNTQFVTAYPNYPSLC